MPASTTVPVLLAADPHAYAPIAASLCALAVFAICVLLLAPTFGAAEADAEADADAEELDGDAAYAAYAEGDEAPHDGDHDRAPAPAAGP